MASPHYVATVHAGKPQVAMLTRRWYLCYNTVHLSLPATCMHNRSVD